MPRVPGPVEADTRQFGLSMPGPSAELAAVPGRQLQAVGNALQNVGAEGVRIALDMQSEINRTRVIAAQNQARVLRDRLQFGDDQEIGFSGLKGEAALAVDGRPMTQVFGERLDKGIAEIGDALDNDAQKKAFGIAAGAMRAEFEGNLRAHQFTEFKRYQASTYENAVRLGVDEVAARWSDPAKVLRLIDGDPVPGSDNQRYGGIRQTAERLARVRGEEPSYAVKQAVSAAHLGVIVQALSNRKVGYAATWLAQHKGDMLESDVLKVNDDIVRHVDATTSQVAVNAAAKEMSTSFAPTRFDNLVNVVMGLESNGRDFTDGKPTTSAKGARYAMQVMPDTAKNPGFGIKPAANDSPDEYNRVGREYLAALVSKYGNTAQAMAAYNAGPGAVDEAIATARRDKAPGAWMSFLPAETRAYVAKGLERIDAGTRPAKPTENDFVERAVAIARDAGASAEAIKLTRAGAEHQFRIIERSITDREQGAYADAMRWLEGNGGNYGRMPPGLLDAVNPKEWDSLRSYGAKVAKGDDRTNWAVYQKLATDGKYLKGLSDNAFYRLRSELSESDFKHFANERGNLLKGTTGKSPEDIDTSALNGILADRLRSMGRDPTPKDGSDDAALVGEMRGFLRRSIIDAQIAAGKKFSDADIEKHVDGLFAKSTTFRSTFLGFETGGVVRKQILGMKPGDIPGAVRDRIEADFKARGIDATDEQVLGAYWMLTR